MKKKHCSFFVMDKLSKNDTYGDMEYCESDSPEKNEENTMCNINQSKLGQIQCLHRRLLYTKMRAD